MEQRSRAGDLAASRKELYTNIVLMYRLRESEAGVLEEVLGKMSKQELRLLCKIVRIANKAILT